MIRALENATGRLRLIKRAEGYEREVASGCDFWEVMVNRYGLSLDVVGGTLSSIPSSSPLVVIANHPYGILDGLMLGHILAQTRPDFRILAHQVFRKAEELNRVILPIDFSETKEALQLNIKTRKKSLSYLVEGGAIGVFPGGTVSTALKPFSHPMDPSWRTFTAKLVVKSRATVVPVFFEGHNSRLFQIASHLNYNLRMALLIQEFKKRVDEPVRVVIGQPICSDALKQEAPDGRALMDRLREETYKLSPKPLKSNAYGYEYEEHHRT
ncbi:MAG: lysophospholipid acyltransferase family protein [Hyphomicrobiales bacterium]